MMKTHNLYFSYGANMNREILIRRVGPEIECIGPYVLKNHKLVFNINNPSEINIGWGNVEEKTGAAVYGILWRFKRPEEQFSKLDRFEGKSYKRILVEVTPLNGESSEKAQIYASNEGFTRKDRRPWPYYIDAIIEVAKTHGFPKEYIESLEEHPRYQKV